MFTLQHAKKTQSDKVLAYMYIYYILKVHATKELQNVLSLSDKTQRQTINEGMHKPYKCDKFGKQKPPQNLIISPEDMPN